MSFSLTLLGDVSGLADPLAEAAPEAAPEA